MTLPFKFDFKMAKIMLPGVVDSYAIAPTPFFSDREAEVKNLPNQKDT